MSSKCFPDASTVRRNIILFQQDGQTGHLQCAVWWPVCQLKSNVQEKKKTNKRILLVGLLGFAGCSTTWCKNAAQERRRRGQNFHFSLPLRELSTMWCMLKLGCKPATSVSKLLAPLWHLLGVCFCCRLSACWVCPLSCPVLSCTQRLLRAKRSSSKGSFLPLHGSVWRGQNSSGSQDNKTGSLPVSCQVTLFSNSSSDKTHHTVYAW